MDVILTVAGLGSHFGGPSRSIPALAEALALEGVTTEIATCTCAGKFGTAVMPVSRLVRTSFLASAARAQWMSRRNEFFKFLFDRRRRPLVVHDNGLWLPTNHAVACAVRRLKLVRVVSPRGMLTRWALAHHRHKKRLAWLLFQKRDLTDADLLHATSPEEVDDCRRAGLLGPIALIPNGVELPPDTASRGHQLGGDRTALYVGRLHEKKGLNNLIEAWNLVRPSFWKVVIAGCDKNAHADRLKAAVRARGLQDVFCFVGHVEGEDKWRLYRQADLFVFPSHSENFGISIGEALGFGLPVITTRGTPWHELLSHNCGWWEEIGVEPLARALHQATKLPPEERARMGERGRTLVELKYSWTSAARQMKSVYEWLLQVAPRPDCVTTA